MCLPERVYRGLNCWILYRILWQLLVSICIYRNIHSKSFVDIKIQLALMRHVSDTIEKKIENKYFTFCTSTEYILSGNTKLSISYSFTVHTRPYLQTFHVTHFRCEKELIYRIVSSRTDPCVFMNVCICKH